MPVLSQNVTFPLRAAWFRAVLVLAALVFITAMAASEGTTAVTGATRGAVVTSVITSDEFMGRLKEPYALYYDKAKNRLYVSDSVGGRLVSFDGKFDYLSELSDERLKMPLSLYKNDAGEFYALDGVSNEIKVINLQEKLIRPLKLSGVPSGREEFLPGGFAADSGGNLYVIDRMNSRIALFDSKGAFVRAFTPPKGDKVRLIKDVRVDKSGNVYAVAPFEAALYVFNKKGELDFRVFGGGKSGKDLVSPVSVDVDSGGLIHVLDRLAGRIAVFMKGSSEALYFIGKPGHNEGQFFAPSYILIDDNNRIFVVDGNRVQIFSTEKRK